MSQEKCNLGEVLSNIINKNLDRTEEYKAFVQLQNSIEELKTLHNNPRRLHENIHFDSQIHQQYVAKRREVSHMLLPLFDKLCSLDMLTGVSKGQSGYTSMDNLAEPCENSGIQLSLQNQWCENCQNWAGVFGCRRCG